MSRKSPLEKSKFRKASKDYDRPKKADTLSQFVRPDSRRGMGASRREALTQWAEGKSNA